MNTGFCITLIILGLIWLVNAATNNGRKNLAQQSWWFAIILIILLLLGWYHHPQPSSLFSLTPKLEGK